MLLDDSIQEKPYTDENEIICWHYSHAKSRQVKGVNLLSYIASAWIKTTDAWLKGLLDSRYRFQFHTL